MSRLEEKTIDYAKMTSNLENWKSKQNHKSPMTLTEKILYAHLDPSDQKASFEVV
jgi:hypothetical protein